MRSCARKALGATAKANAKSGKLKRKHKEADDSVDEHVDESENEEEVPVKSKAGKSGKSGNSKDTVPYPSDLKLTAKDLKDNQAMSVKEVVFT